MNMTPEARRFLQELADKGGSVPVRKLSCQISQKENSARQFCRRNRLASYSKRVWTLWDNGRKALEGM
jgi:hypothetical protein